MDGALEVPSLCWALLAQPGEEEAATIANSSAEELASSMVYRGSKGLSREKPTTNNTPSARRVGPMRSAMAFADKCRAELQIRRDGLQVAP